MNLLGGEEGRGFAQLMQQLPQERLTTASIAVARLERAVKLTVEYTKQRHVFGKPLFAMQNTRFELAECATLQRVCRTFVDDCIASRLEGGLDVTTAAMAKHWASDPACRGVDRCLQRSGGDGDMKELDARSL
ncbi:acyl-CoA dehydrogenase family protein [Corallococcus exercitus]|uniref:acyl-CoA dehydrogenase family protein n=1 Tax=Corallococcus exercitus TaxID=2316736 RepID=UPI003461F36A